MRTGMFVIVFAALSVALSVNARTWEDRRGRTIEADFVRFVGSDQVVIRRDRDRKTFTIRINTLSNADQKYLQSVRDRKSASKVKVSPLVLKIGTGVLVIVDIFLFILLGKVFFGGLSGFVECLRFWFQPDWISWFRGEGFEDMAGEFKLFVYFVLCVAIVIGEFILTSHYLIAG